MTLHRVHTPIASTVKENFCKMIIKKVDENHAKIKPYICLLYACCMALPTCLLLLPPTFRCHITSYADASPHLGQCNAEAPTDAIWYNSGQAQAERAPTKKKKNTNYEKKLWNSVK